jgi:hypothetical protein
LDPNGDANPAGSPETMPSARSSSRMRAAAPPIDATLNAQVPVATNDRSGAEPDADERASRSATHPEQQRPQPSAES